MAPAAPTLRLLEPTDDLVALTDLLHQAYGALAAQGLKYWATHQSVEDTARRCASGETWLAVRDARVLGTVTLRPPGTSRGAPWYERADVAVFGQFAVHPDAQGQGIAARLLGHVEARAAALGAAHVACDTAEQADALIAMYGRRGYRFVAYFDKRPQVNFRSVILSRPVPTAA